MGKKTKPKTSRNSPKWKKAAGKKPLSEQTILQNAFSLCRQGDIPGAEQLFDTLQKIQSKDSAFLNQLGILAHMLGKSDIGLSYLHESIKLCPTAPFYNNLGLVQEQSEDLDNAQHSYEQAIALDPNFPKSHYNLGNVFQKRSQLEQAIDEYQKAIHLKHDYALAYNNLGYVLHKMGLFCEAEISLRNCLKITPTSLDALTNMASVLCSLGNHQEAIILANQVLTLDPHNYEAYKYLCLSQYGMGEAEEAVNSCKKALIHQENKETFFTILGTIYESTGDKQEAAKYYRKSLNLSPDDGILHFKLSRLHKYNHSNEHLTEMESIYTSSSTSTNRHLLCMALGKAYEDLHTTQKAFQFINEGNSLARSTYTYNTANEASFFKKIQSIFRPEFIQQVKEYGYRYANPIFIVGMPRSGTTLVEQILASHPDVYGGGELTTLDLITRQTLLKENKLLYPDDIKALAPQNFTEMGQKYANRTKRHCQDSQRITNKMPHNFLYVGLIHIILPESKIIHCKRDPLDTCWSNYKNFFDSPHLYAQDLKELGEYYNLYRELMAYWREILPQRMHEIEYEKLIEHQEEETRKLLQHCNISWDDSCMNYYQSSGQVYTSSMSQVRTPIYSSSINTWKNYENELKPLSDILNSRQE